MRVLVVHGSSRGGTAGLAAMIGDALARRGFETTVAAAAEIDELTGYDAVIVGGALYNNRWHPDATTFVHRLRGVLQGLPVWFFSSGPLDDSARSGALAPVPQVRELARVTDVRGHITFGGVLAHRPTGRLAGLFSYGPAGDWRDPRQVEEWVGRVELQLSSSPSPLAQLRVPRERQPDALVAAPATIVLPDAERSEPHHAGGLARIRRLLADEELEDDAGLDVIL